MKQSIFTILSNTPLTDCVYKWCFPETPPPSPRGAVCQHSNHREVPPPSHFRVRL